jgi:hypothetical protein
VIKVRTHTHTHTHTTHPYSSMAEQKQGQEHGLDELAEIAVIMLKNKTFSVTQSL